MEGNQILVDIPMCVYNHGKYLEKAIEGILNQKTNFGFRLVIGEDCSTDNSREIVKKYLPENSDKMKVFFHEHNLGAHENSRILFEECKAKYVALCDGDDYWIDLQKLQKQIDFLEMHPDYSICFSNIYQIVDNKKPQLSPFYFSMKEGTYTIEELARGNFINTPSTVFRNGLIKETPKWINETPIGDYVFHLLNAQHGKIKYFQEPMSVYRYHNTGTWAGKSNKFQYENMLTVINHLIDYFQESPVVIKNLKFQAAHQKSKLAEIYLSEQNKDECLKLLKEAFILSPEFMDEWLIDIQNKYNNLGTSTEYKIGWALKNPWFMIKKYALPQKAKK